MVIKVTILKHRSALAFSIPPSIVTGFVRANTIRQLAIIMISDIHESFFI